MTYYEQNDKITYDRADGVVESFVSVHGEELQFVTAKRVCLRMEIEPSQHNQQRVYDALDRRFEQSDRWKGTPQYFEVEL